MERMNMTQWLKKVWKGDTVYEEPICFLDNDTLVGGDLLFTPSKVIRVVSSDGCIFYEEGKDYTVKGNKILRTSNSNIPVLARDTYCVPFSGDKSTEWLRLEDGENYVKIFPEIYQYQVLVTYQHEEKWDGIVPENYSALLPRTMGILEKKEHLNLVYYGDSITAGWEASGCDEQVIDMHTLNEFHNYLNRSPYLPTWASLVTTAISEHYGYNDITKINRGAGGASTLWGKLHAEELVNHHNPDLVILAFGMNNLQDEPEQYKEEIIGILEAIRKQIPNCEFLLVSPMIPNTEIRCLCNNKLERHQEVLFHLQKSLQGVAVVPVYSMFRELSHRGKKYLDITGNCINHPNDFSIRIYAQTILGTLGI